MKKFQKLLSKISCFVLAAAVLFSISGCGEQTETLQRSNEVYGTPVMSSKTLAAVPRTLPDVSNGGLGQYPAYGGNFTKEQNAAVLAENKQILDYDSMDAAGNLYKAGGAIGKKLTKHTASAGLYFGSIDDDAPAVMKRIRINPASIGTNLTGLYAPPGEVVTILLSETDATRKMRVVIGQSSQRGGGVNIPVDKNFSRMPQLVKTMTLSTSENFVGSPLGGPIYLLNEGDAALKGKPYEVTIIGAVEMPMYQLGQTSDAEWERLALSPAPLFDLETIGGVRLTMPAKYVRSFSGKDMRRIAEFWDKSAQLANRVSNGGWFASHPVTMIYDTYVPAGAAVAFVGADFCVLPTSWASNAMNYESFMTSGGWGNLHEMNHHHQGWGAGNNGEVTNNVINAMIYCLNTNIAASRTEEGGLAGGNWATCADATLKKTLEYKAQGKKNQEVSMYVDLLHAFGADAMIEMANKSRANNEDAWYLAACEVTGYDLTYYLKDICGLDISQVNIDAVKAKKLPVFVPVASVYQSGRDVITDHTDKGEPIFTQVEMGRPFYIFTGESKVLDLNKYITVPEGIEFEIKNVTKPKLGTLEQAAEDGAELPGRYVYTPPKSTSAADAFYVTLSLKNTLDPEMEIEDVTLKLSFMQDAQGISGREWEDIGYTDLESAIDDYFYNKLEPLASVRTSYAGYAGKTKKTLSEVEGKLAFPSSGKYTIYLKGGKEALLYAGTDRENLKPVAKIDSTTQNYNKELDGSFFTVELAAKQPLYFKLYIRSDETSAGFARLGMNDASQQQGAPPVFEGDNAVGNVGDVPIVDIPSAYVYNINADIDTPKKSDFDSGRIYAKEYLASAGIDFVMNQLKVTCPPEQVFNNIPVSNMLDGNLNTHSHTKPVYDPAPFTPCEFTFNLGDTYEFNSMSFTYRPDGRGRIKDYKLYFGNSPIDFTDPKLLPAVTGTFPSAAKNIAVFKQVRARYVKLVVTDTYYANAAAKEKYVAISTVNFGVGIQNGEIVPHNGTDIVYKGKWRENTFGTFLNGSSYETSGGSMEVHFHGTAFALFGKTGREYGKAEMRIDGGAWQTVSFHSGGDRYNVPIYIQADMADTYHKIEIRAKGMINIDYMAFNPTVPPQAQPIGAFVWVLIVLGVVVLGAGAGVGAYFLTRWTKEKKRRSGGARSELSAPAFSAATVPSDIKLSDPFESQDDFFKDPAAETAATTAVKPVKKAESASQTAADWVYVPKKNNAADLFGDNFTTNAPKKKSVESQVKAAPKSDEKQKAVPKKEGAAAAAKTTVKPAPIAAESKQNSKIAPKKTDGGKEAPVKTAVKRVEKKAEPKKGGETEKKPAEKTAPAKNEKPAQKQESKAVKAATSPKTEPEKKAGKGKK